MKRYFSLLTMILILALFIYFFLLNVETSVSVKFSGSLTTPSLPLGLVVLIAFLLGFVTGFLFYPLTYVIKKLS